MKKDFTEIVFILDRSGSMSGLEDDTIGGFNAMLKKMKKQEGGAAVSTVLFDDRTDVIHDRVDIHRVKKLTPEDYYVRGATALLDAVGGSIHHITRIYREMEPAEIPEHTMFVITTDGMENASRRYSYGRVKRMIEHEKEKYGWEFLFLGANIDAAETAGRFGIGADRAVNYNCDGAGIALNYDVLAETVGNVRSGRGITSHWKKRIDRDYKKRGVRR